MPDPSPPELADLLRDLFDATELRIHLARGPEGRDLLHALPGTIASHQALAHEAAAALIRRGLVDREFFQRLAEARPQRREAINAVRDVWIAGRRPASGMLWGGRYRLTERLGDGGIGCVWSGVDQQTGQIVAVKILHPRHQGDPRMRQRFFRGAAILEHLTHPAIVRVASAVLESKQECCYAMEYVRGVTLEVGVRERRRPQRVLIDLALQVGDALAYVHQRGRLHRDVTPSNILVTDEGGVRLIDFDLVTGDDYTSLTTQAVGTGLYMPPEAHTSDPRTAAYDVYSLARTIEFVIRGREPNARELGDISDLPASAEVRALLRAALVSDPWQRIPDMASFCEALRRALHAEAPAPPRVAGGPRVSGGPRAPGRPSSTAAPPPATAPPTAEAVPSTAEQSARDRIKVAAIASIVLHTVNILGISPPHEPVPFLVILIVPSVRVLTDREDSRLVNVLHWIWIVFWLVPGVVVFAALFDARSSGVKTFPGVLLIAGIAVGFYASAAYLRRPRAR